MHNIKDLYTIAFYNLENLFDTKNNPLILDDDFTPFGDNKWNEERYENKIYKLGKAISQIGIEQTGKAPALVGLAEVENKNVIRDLIASEHLAGSSYDFVHYDSPDERGIDTALLYNRDCFEVFSAEVFPLMVYAENGTRDYTRDVLYVSGNLNGERIHLLVNHWPSRREGADETEYKRIEAAKNVREIIDEIKLGEEDPSLIIMGDFNDDPISESIQNFLMDSDLYNPMSRLLDPTQKGSLNHRSKWNLFDQIIFSTNFFNTQPDTHSFANADIFDERFLQEWHGNYKGNPFRTFAGRKYLGGISDHFPVYILLKKNH